MKTGKHHNHNPWNRGKRGVQPSTRKGKKFPERQGEKAPNWKGGYGHFLKWQAAYLLKKKELKAGRPRPDYCELCSIASNRICFDHDHVTGLFRGWICHRCNATLGFVEDSPELLEKLAQYLRVAKKNSESSY